MRAPLLVEIGCEEIPARVISSAAADLRERIVAVLDQASIEHGGAREWGGARRLAVRIEEVADRTPDREEQVLGPPASASFAADGSLTPAGAGFARKHGISRSALERIPTDKGVYCGFRRRVDGRPLRDVLAAGLPPTVAAMPFPKTMRWGEGTWRWVRPVHWVVALYGDEAIPVELFGVRAGRVSRGHRFLATGAVEIEHADRYLDRLREAKVIVDPAERRSRLLGRLREAAAAEGGALVEDERLLAEVSDLLEWPSVILGRFDEAFLDLPREILATALRRHQKAFCVERDGRLAPIFLTAANTDGDPAGHVRRGNEWVVGGRLQDARFFWGEDRKLPLEARLAALRDLAFHERAGSYAEKAERTAALARAIGEAIGLPRETVEAAERAARLAKTDLVSGIVGEFPELQGIAGGLLLRHEGAPEPVWRAVQEHYRPEGPDDPLPQTEAGSVVSAADKLDKVARLLELGEVPTGSRDPYGLRRAANGIFRVLLERRWNLPVTDLCRLGGGAEPLAEFLAERLDSFLRDRGFTAHEVRAVVRAARDRLPPWPLADIEARLEALRAVRERADFDRLVELTRRVENIRSKADDDLLRRTESAPGSLGYRERAPAALRLAELLGRAGPAMERASGEGDYVRVAALLAQFVEPVETFFQQVLVLDPDDLDATRHRLGLMSNLHEVLTRYFDLTELPGEAGRKQ